MEVDVTLLRRWQEMAERFPGVWSVCCDHPEGQVVIQGEIKEGVHMEAGVSFDSSSQIAEDGLEAEVLCFIACDMAISSLLL